MTEQYDENRWNAFESSGRIADYLSYKGIGGSTLPTTREVKGLADNNRGRGDILKGRGR